MQDTYKHKGMRRELIGELRGMGIRDERILEAFDLIPRHFFLDLAFTNQAYSNIAFRIGAGQTISQPYTVAFQTELLNLKKGDRVLEIGTGSAFQTCILCQLGAKVVSVERQRELYVRARKMTEQFNFNPRLYYGDGYKGQPAFAPYDKVLVTCGAPYIPDALKTQLKIGGVLVIPLGDGNIQRMIRLTRISEEEFKEEDFGNFSFVPMLKDRS